MIVKDQRTGFCGLSAASEHRYGNRQVFSWRLCLLLALVVFLSAAGESLAAWADNQMLHNSNRFTGTTKWGGKWGTDDPTAKYGPIDCSTCHEKNAGNIKRVKKTLIAPNGTDQFPIQADPTPPAGGVSFLDAREGVSDFGDDVNRSGDATQSNKICEACHSQTKFHNYNVANNTDGTSHYNQADCIACHKHNSGFKPLACDACHGNPPTADVARAGDGLAFDPQVTGSATAGKHATHVATLGYACNNCHNNYVMPAESAVKPGFSDISIAFSNFGSTTGTYSGQVGLSYNNMLGTGGLTCATVYCHSAGQSATGAVLTAGDYAAPSWTGTVACGSCHKVSEVGGLTSGSHAAHLGTTLGNVTVNGCGDCHAGAANNASAYASAEHVDGTIDAVGGYSQGGSHPVGNGYGTCATASCHDNGTGTPGATPIWGTVVSDCSECHARKPATGSHAKHLTGQTISSAIDCAACHAGAVEATTAPAQHLDGNLDVYDTAAGDLGYPADAAKGGVPYNSCSAAYCHSNGKGTFKTVAWGVTSTGCNFCHDNPPAGGHPSDADCSKCHNHVAAADNAFTDLTKHINGTVEAQVDSCTTCHGAGAYKDPETADPDHKAHTSVATFLAGKTISGGGLGGAGWYSVSYDATSKPLMGCGQCHPANLHRDGTVQTDLDPAGETIAAPNAKRNNLAGAMFNGSQCSSVYCHSDGVTDGSYINSPTWDATAFNANLTCASCHGNSPTTGTHNWHEVGIHYKTLYDDDGDGLMPAAAAPATDAGAAHGNTATADTIGCQTCHNNTVAAEYNAGNSVCGTCHVDSNAPATGNELAVIKASSTAHLDGAKTVIFGSLTGFKSKSQLRNDITTVPALNSSWTRTNSYKAAAGNSYELGKNAAPTWDSGAKTCSTVDCHNGIVTPAWSGGSSANCLACHTTLPQ